MSYGPRGRMKEISGAHDLFMTRTYIYSRFNKIRT